jgi:hypothetical protein
MNYLPNDIKYLIFEFSENKNMRILCKDFKDYLDLVRESFLELLDNEKLFIKYQLAKYERKINGQSYRQKKFLEDCKKIIINRKNINNQFVTCKENNLKFDKKFLENLIPCSEFTENYSMNEIFRGYLIFWEVENIEINNLQIFKKLQLLY